MSTLANDRVLLEASADDFAFHTGQMVESILVDRGIETALNSGLSVVTLEHMKSCIDDALLDRLRDQLGIRLNDVSERDRSKIA